jgi:hypothetical protein
VPKEARSDEELIELGPEDETELERAIVEADQAERQGTLVPWTRLSLSGAIASGESVRGLLTPHATRELDQARAAGRTLDLDEEVAEAFRRLEALPQTGARVRIPGQWSTTVRRVIGAATTSITALVSKWA